jgi:hypothetical protein
MAAMRIASTSVNRCSCPVPGPGEPPPSGGSDASSEPSDGEAKAADAAAALYDPWEEPAPPRWPPGILSRENEEIIAALALRDGLDFGAQALTFISAASGAAPKNARFRPYTHSDWSVPPIVWIMLIADSGQRKTALLQNAFSSLRGINGSQWDDYDKARDNWNTLSDADKRAAGKPREPHSYIVQDITPEALQMILAANDRGTLMLKDELASMFDFGRYSAGSGGSERAFYLESYEGNPYTVHRVGRERARIRNCGLTIFGGTHLRHQLPRYTGRWRDDPADRARREGFRRDQFFRQWTMPPQTDMAASFINDWPARSSSTSPWQRSGAHQHTRFFPRSSGNAAISSGWSQIHVRYLAMTSARVPSRGLFGLSITNGLPHLLPAKRPVRRPM